MAVFGAAFAQTSIPVFSGGPLETFDKLAAGPYLSISGYSNGFAGFNAGAQFTTVGAGALFVNDNTLMLAPYSVKNAMYARGANVRIRFNQTWRKFGGRFRVPTDGAGVTTMRVFFYRSGVLVGSPVIASIGKTAWQWRGWDCAMLGGFDEVRIFGNGPVAGFVGMDHLTVNHRSSIHKLKLACWRP